MVVGVGSCLEWCIVGVVVGVVVVLMVLVLVIVMEPSISVPAATSSSSPSPAPLATWAWRHAPPLSGPPLVATAGMLPIGIGAVAVGGAVQGVAALAALIVLIETALVALLPALVGTRGSHARGRGLEGKGQQGVFLRWGKRGRGWGGLGLGCTASSFFPLLALPSNFPKTQGHQGGAGGAPGQPVGGVTLEGKFEFALLWRNEASSAGQVNRDDRRVRTCEEGGRGNRK